PSYSASPALLFFQAEDGIRDFHVTGVQTCALPIYLPPLGPVYVETGFMANRVASRTASAEDMMLQHETPLVLWSNKRGAERGTEIGRASCRERGKIQGANQDAQPKHTPVSIQQRQC